MTEPVLELRDLRVEIDTPGGRIRPVADVSLTLEAGQALGLVGESGSGKSLTLRAILGLLPRRARIAGGSVLLDGRPLVGASALRHVRGREIGMVFQEPQTALNPVMRVGDQIAEGPRAVLGYSHRRARERAFELMREVGIPDPVRRAEAYPHELSGGLRQRVMIAIALALEPRILLCDEPTTALDVTVQGQILRLLADLRERTGVALVYVSHDLAVVSQTCRDLAVMYAGVVVETGPVRHVFADPRHPYTRALLRSVIALDTSGREPEPIPGSPPDAGAPPSGCHFHPRCAFRHEICDTGDYPLLPLGPARASACAFHDELPHGV
ncbi:MAG: peptide/nickel transport system ATP-binding protein [Gaiellales bacterium]|nr:peptide/nickel transport system ATP-binding protein [Gaiellales bacterium]